MMIPRDVGLFAMVRSTSSRPLSPVDDSMARVLYTPRARGRGALEGAGDGGAPAQDVVDGQGGLGQFLRLPVGFTCRMATLVS